MCLRNGNAVAGERRRDGAATAGAVSAGHPENRKETRMRARQWMQIAAVASAVGLAGGAIANDMDRTAPSSDDASATVNGNPAAQLGGDATNPSSSMNGNPAAQLGGDATNPSSSAAPGTAVPTPGYGTAAPSTDVDSSTAIGNDASTSTLDNDATGTTQGSTMVSPKSDMTTNAPSGGARYGSGSSATSISGSDRLGSTNSANFDQWASDYASQHNGRITRQEFLNQMANRWDRLDMQHRGYLTPQEMDEFFVAAPDESATPPRTGSDVRPGDMGPGSAKGD
jgi:hypothetical protein